MKNDEKAERRLFCNRTLNMRSIRAIGYDMDYTLIHYKVEEWEKRAYEYLRQHFEAIGWPVADKTFDPTIVRRGLIVDTQLGNLVKSNRFGFVKQAVHGTKQIAFDELRNLYGRVIVDLAEPRWVFLNTLFSISEGCMYMQLTELLDEGLLPGVLGYEELYRRVRDAMNTAHMEGRLKADIIADPDRFVVLDPEVPMTLLDQKFAGKKLMLITNSDWHYTASMMCYAFDRFLPKGTTWRELFDVVIIGARKPEFFIQENPFFEVVTQDGLLKPNVMSLEPKKVYLGGSARQIESYLGLSGDEFLYVGDHMYGDVHVTKNILRWRTALIVRELEEEIASMHRFKPNEEKLAKMMVKKESLEARICDLRLAVQRAEKGYDAKLTSSVEELKKELLAEKAVFERLDQEIAPMARASAELSNSSWGLLMRTGNDKSLLAFQVERYADVYTSRVSNFLHATPFAYLRSFRGVLPHDAIAWCTFDSN